MNPASTATARQTVTIVGPNLRDQSKGTFHVHAAGCADLRRSPNLKHEDQSWSIAATSREHIAGVVYEDHIAEAEDMTAADYLGDFHFAPCVTLPVSAPMLHPDEQTAIVEQCTDALSDVIIDRLAGLGFDGENAGDAESACYAAVAQKIAPPNFAAGNALLAGDWDTAGSDTLYLPRDVGDRLLERQGWVLEPVGRGYLAYTMPGRTPRSEGGEAFTDYVWERGDAITRALIAEALR